MFAACIGAVRDGLNRIAVEWHVQEPNDPFTYAVGEKPRLKECLNKKIRQLKRWAEWYCLSHFPLPLFAEVAHETSQPLIVGIPRPPTPQPIQESPSLKGARAPFSEYNGRLVWQALKCAKGICAH